MASAKTFSMAIGIDLGTTYSRVGVWKNDRFEIINNDQGNRTTPSHVSFYTNERLIGDAAKTRVATNPHNTVFNVKRLIGRRFDDADVQSDIRQLPFEVYNKSGKPYIRVEYRGEKKEFCSEEITSMLLSKMKEVAETYLGTPVTDAVVTVPVDFTDSQRQATKDAGAIAGLNILRTITDSTAATIAYGLNNKALTEERKALIFDLGGGTLDVSLVTIAGDVIQVNAVAGDTHLGGEDFDNRLVKYFMEEFKRKKEIDLGNNPRAISLLRTACERAKCILSSATSAPIEIDSLYDGIDFYTSLSRARFEGLCENLFQGALKLIEKVLRDSKTNKSDVHDIVLIGGSSRIPRIVKLVSEFFGGKGPGGSINPEEAVAYGAAVQAAILSQNTSVKIQNMVCLNVSSRSLGIGAANGLAEILIKRNTIIPKTKSKVFTTQSDNESDLLIEVYEGDRVRTKDNNILGKIGISGILPAPRGVPQIEVTFNINASGDLDVSARDMASGNKGGPIAMTRNDDRLSREELHRMIKDAQKYKAEDEAAAACIAARNGLEAYAYTIRNMITKLEIQVNATISWLEDSQEVSKEEYDLMWDELENTVK